MTQSVIVAKIDNKIKQQAQELAKSFGLNLSSLINIQLRNFIKIKKLTIGETDDTHRSYYENNPEYIDVNVSGEEFLKTLKKYRNKKSGKNG
ncbi:MAG: hypothetical protein NTY80_02680 [candidate division SR1 bacterium]|nr:hypothetical protein [candidate division SR1 bacterium]